VPATPKLVLIAVAAFSPCVRAAQQQNAPYELVLRSDGLSSQNLQDIHEATIRSGWPPEQIRELVGLKVRDLGYFNSQIEEQRQMVRGPDGREHLQLTENIRLGVQYRVGSIEIEKATVFTPEQLRRDLLVAPGDLLIPAQVVKSLEQMRKLYAEKGYIAVITPVVCFNSSKQLADISLNFDEGMPHKFGALLLNGVEPEPGVAKQLWASWKTLHGQMFSPSALDKWLQANRTICPTCTKPQNISVTLHDDTRINQPLKPVADVTLKFPPHPLQ
jgi:hypothetical protein